MTGLTRDTLASVAEGAMGQPPSVAIVVGGRFIAFDLARSLERRAALAGIVSAYPRARAEGISPARLRWNPVLGFADAVSRRMLRDRSGRAGYRRAIQFGRWAARQLPRADVVQAWTGYALDSIVAARREGMASVAFRASAHIEAQAELIQTEYEEFGFAAPAVYRPMIDRELEEYAAADAVNVISTFAYRTFIERGHPASRLILTPLGVDVGEVAGVARTARTTGPLRVLFLGTVSLQKGVHYLLQAVHGFNSSAVTVSLVGGATADGHELLRRFARPGEWKGRVPRGELRTILSEHDVLVLPSVQDGFGAVICEAMAAGLPVIATENTGAPDVIRDGVDGFIVPARSVDALREALEALVSDRGRCVAMGEAAANGIATERTWDRFADEMLIEYSRLAKRVRAKE